MIIKQYPSADTAVQAVVHDYFPDNSNRLPPTDFCDGIADAFTFNDPENRWAVY